MLELSPRLFRIAKLPPEDMQAELLELAAQQQRLEHRRKIVRKSTQKWRDNSSHDGSREPVHNAVHVNAVILSKEVSKKEKEVSNNRVSKKRSIIPAGLVCSDKNIADAIRIGVLEASIPIEWEGYKDHHIHKATLGTDWSAAWRGWCRNHVKWNNKLSAKPERKKTIHDRADELLAAAATSLSQDRPQAGCKLVGGPVKIISTDYRHILVAGTDESLGGDILPISGKRPEGDLLPDDRDGYQF